MPRGERLTGRQVGNDSPAVPPDDGIDGEDTVVNEATQRTDTVSSSPADHVRSDPDAALSGPARAATVPPIGAYALNVLPSEERAAVAADIAASPELQAELGQLLPVARALQKGTRSTATPPREAMPSTLEATASSSAAQSERSVRTAPPRSSTPTATPPVVTDSPERATRAQAASSTRPAAPPRAERRVPRSAPSVAIGRPQIPWLVAGVAAVIALGAVLWARALVDRLDTRDREIAALQSQVGELRTGASARVLTLAPTADGVAGSTGAVYYAPTEGRLVVRVAGLPALEEGRVYQLWYNDGDLESAWTAAAGFRVNAEGETLVSIPGDFTGIMRVAVSSEPLPGSAAPTGPLLMEGTLPASG